eukprot:scaffold224599_cov23-Tisochrysis_lutea.AAC.3
MMRVHAVLAGQCGLLVQRCTPFSQPCMSGLPQTGHSHMLAYSASYTYCSQALVGAIYPATPSAATAYNQYCCSRCSYSIPLQPLQQLYHTTPSSPCTYYSIPLQPLQPSHGHSYPSPPKAQPF